MTWIAGYIGLINNEHASQTLGIVASALLIMSLILFWWTAYSIRQHEFSLAFAQEAPSIIFMHGPFKFVRHPFYLSYLLCYLSVALYTKQYYNYGFFIIMYTVYWLAAKSEEQKMMAVDKQNQYLNYRKEVFTCFPFISSKEAE